MSRTMGPHQLLQRGEIEFFGVLPPAGNFSLRENTLTVKLVKLPLTLTLSAHHPD